MEANIDPTSEEFIRSKHFPRAISGRHFGSREAYIKFLAESEKKRPGRPRKIETGSESDE